MEPILVSVDEACTALGIGRTRFYQEVAAGALRTVKLGRRTLVPMTAIKRFAEALGASA